MAKHASRGRSQNEFLQHFICDRNVCFGYCRAMAPNKSRIFITNLPGELSSYKPVSKFTNRMDGHNKICVIQISHSFPSSVVFKVFHKEV